jgi:APA family basic amino acid/polyamine antiporter
MAEKRSFTRTSSGLVRSMGNRDTIIFSALIGAPMLAAYFSFPLYTSLLPGADMRWASLIPILFAVPAYVLYAAFGSMMPRTGGDYVYQSRGLAPVVGFAIIGAWFVIWFGAINVDAALTAIAAGLSPIFLLSGVTTSNPQLISTGLWFTSTTGILVTSVAMVLLGWLNVSAGLRFSIKTQNYLLFPAVVLTAVLLPLTLLLTSQSTFQANFDNFGQQVAGASNYFSTVMAAGVTAGVASPTLSPLYTLFASFNPAIWEMFAVFPAMGILGEIKNAGSMKFLFRAFLTGGLFGLVVIQTLSFATAYNTFGWGFMQSLASQWLGGQTAFYPTLPLLAGIASGNIVLQILIPLGYLLDGYFLILAIYLIVSRILVAMSIDGSIPDWFSSINSRFRSPVNAVGAAALASVVMATIYSYYPASDLAILQGSLITSIGGMMVTAITAIGFSQRRKQIYEGSPVSRYKVGPIPLLSIVGSIVTGIVAVMLYSYFAYPAMGEVSPSLGLVNGYLIGPLFVVVPVVALVIWFYAYRAHKKSLGVDIDLSFKEIPPA